MSNQLRRRWQVKGRELSCNTASIAAPGPNEIIVRMKAASLNSRDLAILAGAYPNRPEVVPLSDGAGIVHLVGTHVETLKPGDAVVSCFYPHWDGGAANAWNHRGSLGCELDGVLDEFAVLPGSGLAPKPEYLDFAEAATLPCAALTAWSALFVEGDLKPGQSVLIQGTGGVSLFAFQFAQLIGARPIVISSSERKLNFVRSFGANDVINYKRSADWGAKVLEITSGAGVDLVVDVGGSQTLPLSMGCVAVGGRISVVGALSGVSATISIPDMLFRHIEMRGVTVGNRQNFLAMSAALCAAKLQPLIHRKFGFDDAPTMYSELSKGQHIGKLVLEF